MDYPKYPGTDRAMRAADQVEVDGRTRGAIVSILNGDGGLRVGIWTGARPVIYVTDADLIRYCPPPVKIEIPRNLAELCVAAIDIDPDASIDLVELQAIIESALEADG